MKCFSCVLVLISLCGSGFILASSCQSDSLETIVDSVLSDHAGTNKPGATIGVIKNGVLIFQKGYGMANIKSGMRNQADVSYNIASGSKQFTAVVIASLMQQNKLKLTDDVRKYIPELPDYGKTITIENLLYHTSGIRDYMVLMWLTGKSFEDSVTNSYAMEIIIGQRKLNFAPGDQCVYSNSNYVLLAEIIHKITGETLAGYSDLHLFKTMGMNKTEFVLDLKKKSTNISYYKSGDIYVPFKNNYGVYGDGGVITTLSDLVKWDHTFYDTMSLTQQILKRGLLNNGNELQYGMGIMTTMYRNEQIQTHPGAFLGFRSEILRFPKRRISIICLGNSADINPESVTRAIADRYVFGSKEMRSAQPETKSRSIEQTTALTGTYEVVPNVWIEIRNEDGLLTGQATGQQKQILYGADNNSFKIGSTNDRVVFENLDNGKFQKLTIQQKQGNTPANRLIEMPVEDLDRFAGQYYCEEQNATYNFFKKNGDLWFSVGSNPEVKAEVFEKYNRAYFSYLDLERAVIDFRLNSDGTVDGFVLSSGRILDLPFIKK